MSAADVLAHFRLQATESAAYGSPFIAALSAKFADDLEAGGPVADLTAAWPDDPQRDALAMRLAGALHAAVLTGRDDSLAATYPSSTPSWRIEEVWSAARAFLARDQAWVADFLRSPPQTNETRRSAALLAGFLHFAKDWQGPIDMLELGASAGLNQNWDRFFYRTNAWEWGDRASPVRVETVWNGSPPPLDARPNIRHRAACDQNPLDVRDAAQRARLKSYIWADQPDRLTRFDAAAELALQHNTKVDRADAAHWIADKLAARAKDGATAVFHSIFLQYPPQEVRHAIKNAIAAAGEQATAHAPLVWIRLEPEALTDGVRGSLRYILDLTVWPSGERRVLAITDGHARSFEALS